MPPTATPSTPCSAVAVGTAVNAVALAVREARRCWSARRSLPLTWSATSWTCQSRPGAVGPSRSDADGSRPGCASRCLPPIADPGNIRSVTMKLQTWRSLQPVTSPSTSRRIIHRVRSKKVAPRLKFTQEGRQDLGAVIDAAYGRRAMVMLGNIGGSERQPAVT